LRLIEEIFEPSAKMKRASSLLVDIRKCVGKNINKRVIAFLKSWEQTKNSLIVSFRTTSYKTIVKPQGS